LQIRYRLSGPKPGLLSAHLKLNLPPAVGVDVLHPEFERAKLGNDGLDPHRHASEMRPRGRIENGVLALLRQEPGTLDAVELAARIYHINPISKAACSAVWRALSSLARKGLVPGLRDPRNGV
jgi:hypothetical protein